MKDPLLHGRHRDANGEISHKRGDTLIGTLREIYGEGFAAGHHPAMKLSTLLEHERVKSLTEYLRKKPSRIH
jgi:hypothetical protein